ncbi:hypothetical protein IFR05_014619 [Cadophora sp. M221]|nr:hypothetical protein IFR05_014619 [Cadophora sp. M221]
MSTPPPTSDSETDSSSPKSQNDNPRGTSIGIGTSIGGLVFLVIIFIAIGLYRRKGSHIHDVEA